MTEQSEHLSNAQIENYGIRTSGAGPDAAQRDEPQRANHQSIDGQRISDQPINDQAINDQSLSDRQISDRQIDDQRVESHLADCAPCRNRLLGFHRSLFTGVADSPKADPSGSDTLPSDDSPSDQKLADSKVEGSRPPGSALADSNFANPNDPVDPQVRTAPTPECPSIEALRELAAGLTPDNAAPALTRHAATCDHCGPLLRSFTEDFSDDFSPEEQAVLDQLRSASPKWQKQTAKEMLKKARKTPEPVPATDWRRFFSWKWVLVPATAAVIVVATITFPIYLAQRDTPEKVEVLLAQASTERRNLEMRIPYAKYSEFHQKRSGEPTPMLQLPESSRKAADAISSHLKAHPDDPEWLLLSARWYLLDWQFKPALEALEKIENKNPSRQSEIDMVRAMALYEKAAYDPNEYGRAIDLLGTVLQKNPNDPIALHNQAVACEKVQNSVCAIDDWNRLLKIEKDPDWSAEAQKHLNQLQEKKNPASSPSPK